MRDTTGQECYLALMEPPFPIFLSLSLKNVNHCKMIIVDILNIASYRSHGLSLRRKIISYNGQFLRIMLKMSATNPSRWNPTQEIDRRKRPCTVTGLKNIYLLITGLRSSIVLGIFVQYNWLSLTNRLG